ncbi:MAG TPA: hypothetical protein VKI61_04090, partial [Chitinophagaceae bacterium]|nr:hypothetical protein [Chitinophagaceae bacterium]
MELTGRIKELAQLKQIHQADASAFVAVYGRRRVGKTFLLRQAFDNKFDFYLTGLANASTAQQLNSFYFAMMAIDSTAWQRVGPNNWLEAFQQLIALL